MGYEAILQMLQTQGQEHLLAYYPSLSPEEQASLLKQIEKIDWNILTLAKRESAAETKGKIEPLGALELPEIETKKAEYTEKGLQAIREGKIGAVLLAGGQGTRLGYDGPKGTVNIGITKELFIFECLIHNLMDVVRKADCWIHLFVMTSEKNRKETVTFFKEHEYFGYDESHIHFFTQEMAPAVDYDGRLLLEEKGRLALSPNGNGGWFSSMVKSGLLPLLHAEGIEWLNIFAVDNVLQRIADPCFVGATIVSGCTCGAKVVRKASPMERVGVLCLEDKHPSIVEYYEMTEDMIHLRDDDGNLLYNFGVTLNYLFRVDKLKELLHNTLPLHKVEKKIPCLDAEGRLCHPGEPNGYKFETLVLDMVRLMESCLPFEVERNKEFAPIKNKEGVDSIGTAQALLQENGVTL